MYVFAKLSANPLRPVKLETCRPDPLLASWHTQARVVLPPLLHYIDMYVVPCAGGLNFAEGEVSESKPGAEWVKWGRNAVLPHTSMDDAQPTS